MSSSILIPKTADETAAVQAADVVARYAAAKSRQDVEGALRCCHEDFFLDTVAFGIRGSGHGAVAAHLTVFFTTFPDYHVSLEGEAVADGVVTVWGIAHATMRGAFGSLAPTGRAFALPFACVFPVHDGLLAGERFFFDLNMMCEQLGLPVEQVAAELRAFRDAHRIEMPGVLLTDSNGAAMRSTQ